MLARDPGMRRSWRTSIPCGRAFSRWVPTFSSPTGADIGIPAWARSGRLSFSARARVTTPETPKQEPAQDKNYNVKYLLGKIRDEGI